MRFANFFEDLIERLRIKKIERYNLKQIERAKRETEKLLNSSKSNLSRYSLNSPNSRYGPKSSKSSKSSKSANYALTSSTQNATSRYKVFYNRFFGNVAWFSQRSTSRGYKNVWHALKSHIYYIANEKRKDLELAEGLELDKWKAITDSEVAKRWDARIAGKFFLTLPNELTAEQALQLVKSFVENEIQSANIGIAIHRNKGILEGKDNLHAHVVFSARRKDGKKVRLNRKDLSELQRKWDEYLTRAGFQVKTAPWRRQVKAKDFWQNGKINEDVVRYVKTQRHVWALLTKAVDAEKVFRENQAFECRQNQERERERQNQERERERQAMKIRQEEREQKRKEQERKEQERKEQERREEQNRELRMREEQERRQKREQERREDQERERREQEIREEERRKKDQEMIKKREEERREQERRLEQEKERERERKPTTYQGRERKERRKEEPKRKERKEGKEERERKLETFKEQRKEQLRKLFEEKLRKLQQQEQQAKQQRIDSKKTRRFRLE